MTELLRRLVPVEIVLLLALLLTLLAVLQHQKISTLRGELKTASAALETLQKNTRRSAEVDSKTAAAEEATRVQFKVVNREVLRYVQAPDAGRCLLDAEWVRIYNAAVAAPGTTGEADAATGTADAAAGE